MDHNSENRIETELKKITFVKVSTTIFTDLNRHSTVFNSILTSCNNQFNFLKETNQKSCLEFINDNVKYLISGSVDSVEERLKLHEKFNLPKTHPIFLPKMAINIDQEEEIPKVIFDEQLLNPHESLVTKSGYYEAKIDGDDEESDKILVSSIKGDYRYYHYRKDENDKGWGCAYRSLQTLVSWCLLNIRPDIKHPPTFYQIQKALVISGDKPKNFLNSRKWIGSIEVSTVLNELYQIQSKIVHVSKGDQMAEQCRMLISHFDKGGGPVMIGGGVLAHTIIGCKLNQQTGESHYLILDPHYIGPDKIEPIINTGNVAWKPLEFWDKKSFYNMCIPVKEEFNV